MAKVEEPVFEYCESCGIQLKTEEDHGGSDSENKWCKDCCHTDGSHKTKDEVKEHVIKDILTAPDAITVMGEKVTDEETDQLALDYMDKNPAWHVETDDDD